jgi:uncharacterized protein
MRLNQFQIDNIKELAEFSFGKGTTVFLFGSKTDDLKKGGDIDLFIKSDNENTLTTEAKAHFLAKLKSKIGDRKIDVVFDNINTRGKQNFYYSIATNMIEL